MLQVIAMLYLWLKAGHVIFVIFWMAGLFMLPRFFVYHQEAPEASPENAIWVDRRAEAAQDHHVALAVRGVGAWFAAGREW